MDNIEQEFFRVFGIEPKKLFSARQGINPDAVIYSEITAEKLLRMICIAMKYKNAYRFVNGIEDLKEQTLEILISLKDMVSIYAEIQQLFSE